MRRTARLLLPASAVVALLLAPCLSGCSNKPFGRGRTWDVALWSNLSGEASIRGPLPTYQTYDGVQPLQTGLGIALLRQGTGAVAYGYVLPNYAMYSGEPASSSIPFYFEISSFHLEEGPYDLVLFGPLNPFGWDHNEATASSLRVLAHIGVVQLVHGEAVTGLSAVLHSTGPGPYATLRGALLINGNPPISEMAQVVLRPDAPPPGIDASTGLVWHVFADEVRTTGELPYTIEYVSHGGYSLSYAGYDLRDRDDPLAVATMRLSVAGAETTAPELQIGTAWQAQRPYGLGELRGSLSGPQASRVVVIATRSDAPFEEHVSGGYDRHRYAFWHVLPGDTDFRLGWLEPGQYELRVLQPGGASLGPPQTVTISLSEPEVTNLTLEVSP